MGAGRNIPRVGHKLLIDRTQSHGRLRIVASKVAAAH
jgi:hypothetical protein